jgi:hypothetical protein
VALLGALYRSRLKHEIGANIGQHNNPPALAGAALARALGCEDHGIGNAGLGDGFGWRRN